MNTKEYNVFMSEMYKDQEAEWIEQVYDLLLRTGCTESTADSLKSSVANMSTNTRDAFIIWASGHSIGESAKLCGIHKSTLKRALSKVRKSVTLPLRT